MAAVSQTTFSNEFSRMKIYGVWLKFHWSLFLGVQLTITHHYLNQWWLVYRYIYVSLSLSELTSTVVSLKINNIPHKTMNLITYLCSKPRLSLLVKRSPILPFVVLISPWSGDGQWRGAFMFSWVCSWIRGWVNNGEAGDLRCHRTHYDVTVMQIRIDSGWPAEQINLLVAWYSSNLRTGSRPEKPKYDWHNWIKVFFL